MDRPSIHLSVFCFLLIFSFRTCQETTTLLTEEPMVEETTTTEAVVEITTEPVSTYNFDTTPGTARKISNLPQPSRANRTVVYCDKDWSSRDYLLEHPGFPYEYANGLLCRYTIHKNSPSVCGLEITFRKFDLETSPGCHRDFLAIGDERLCGHIPAKSVVQYPFESDSDTLALVFGTNENVTKSGFQILFQQISVCEEDLNAIPAIHACDVLITDPSGELVTHRSAEDALGDPVCRYTIGRRHSGYCHVELDFVDFNVEYSPGCISSYVQLDGHRFCGTSLRGQRKNVTFDTLGNIHVVYKTDTVRLDRGFHLLFRQLVCPPGNAVRSPGGTDLVGDRLPSSCSKIYYEKEFYLESPGFPNYYANDLDCQLVIRRYRPSICKMDIRFLDFDVEESPGCVFDFLQLDSQRLCGRIPEDNVRTVDFLSYEKVLRFKTDSVNPRPGFFLYIRQLDCGSVVQPTVPGSPASCDVHVWDREARITSPNYPRDYGNNLLCRYTVHRQGDHICQLKVTFLDFKLQNGSPGCYNDYLEMDGGWRACGDKFQGISRTLDFRLPEKVLLFGSDSWYTFPGFLIALKQVPCSEVVGGGGETSGRLNGDAPSCDREFEAATFDLRSELYPINYLPNLDCRYVIRKVSQSVCQLKIRFTHFDLEISSGCNRDYLALDGQKLCGSLPVNTTSKYVIRKVSQSVCQLKIRFTHFDLEISSGCNRDYLALDGQKLCGSLPVNTTRNLRFDTPEKVILFHSNSDIQASGFSASVQQVECPGGFPPVDDPYTPPVSGGGPSTAPAPSGSSCSRPFTEIRSTFNSPNYPAPYPAGVACRYTFHLQPGFCSVEYNFVEFLLEPSGPGLPCTRDYLEISGVRYCGQQLRGATRLEYPVSGTREIILTFFSDAVVSDKGFLASFRQVSCGSAPPPPPPPHLPPQQPPRGGGPTTSDTSTSNSACGGHLTGPYFEIKWPDLGSTGDYGQTVQCVYTVHRLGSDTCTLRVTFVTFDLGDGRDCPRQFVQIGEHTLCGRLPSYTVRDYNLHDYTVVIRATSSQLPRPRMLLQVQQVPCGVSSPPVRSPPPSCDETFDGPGFELRSPYYPHGLSSNVDCRYIVRKSSPFACHLELTFERFELPDTRHCYASHLRIDADRLCGSITPYSVRLYDFTTSEKLIHFSADHVLPGAGFVIKGRQVPCGGVPPSALMPVAPSPVDQGRSRTPDHITPSSRRCDQSYGLEEFTIFSPDHPSYYPSDVYCRFVVIRSGAEVCGLEVTFVQFDLEDYYQCQRDYLDIDGERLCGVLPPQSVRNYVFHPADRTKVITFRSDHSNTRLGFILRVRQSRICPASVPSLLPSSPSGPGSPIPPSTSRNPSTGGSSVCETSYFSSPRGSIRSPRFPSGYPATHCIYTFVQLRGFCSLRLFFRDFDLLPAAECIVDYFELEGRRYCDGQLFQITREVFFPWSDSSTVNVMFHSDRGSFVHRGYHVDYEQIPCKRQGRQQREELELAVNATARSASSPSSSSFTSSATDEDWDDTKTTPKNSTVEYAS